MNEAHADELIGRDVVIRSVAGIEYDGVVRSICSEDGVAELFELGRRRDPAYQRFVIVRQRADQVRFERETDRET